MLPLWNCKVKVKEAKNFILCLKKAGLDASTLPLRKSRLIGTARIIRRVLDTKAGKRISEKESTNLLFQRRKETAFVITHKTVVKVYCYWILYGE